MKEDGAPPTRLESRDVSALFAFAGATSVVVAVSFLAVLVVWLFPHSLADQSLRLPLPEYPSPRLQQDPEADLAHFMKDQETRLNGFGWIDEGAGVAHIPIEQAMRQIDEEKISNWPGEPDKGKPPESSAQESDHGLQIGKTLGAPASAAHRHPHRSGAIIGAARKTGRAPAARRHRH